MEICQECKIKYPTNYVSLIMTSDGNAVVCGICALTISNRIHKTRERRFKGEIAEEMRQKAIKYRKTLDKEICINCKWYGTIQEMTSISGKQYKFSKPVCTFRKSKRSRYSKDADDDYSCANFKKN